MYKLINRNLFARTAHIYDKAFTVKLLYLIETLGLYEAYL